MAAGAPWTVRPDWWSLDSHPMRVQVPATTSFVLAAALDDDHGSGLYTTIECTRPDDRWWIFHQIAEARLDLDVLDAAADTLVAKLVGWKRWEAAYVWRHTIGAWATIDGDFAASGVDLMALPVERATNAAYAWWRRQIGQDADAWRRFTREMEREPVRVIAAEAEQPMDPGVFGQLDQLGKANRRAAPAVVESVITMPEQIP